MLGQFSTVVPRRVRRDAKEMKTLTLWQCVNGDFIDRESLCDGKVNCGDASDEDPAVCSYLPCPISLWRCAYTGQCIKKAYVCDGETQCKDDSDANGYMCKMWPCTTMKCLINDTINNITDPVCLHAGQMCDGNFDCLDKKDEFDCNDTLEMPCSPLHVRCPTSSQCVSVMEMCKGKQYCMGDGEKLMCKAAYGTRITTRQWMLFPCDLGNHLVPRYKVCDGIQDCEDGRDELYQICNGTNECPEGHWRCRSDGVGPGEKRCIRAEFRCDGQYDCFDTSDEADCDEFDCEKGDFECKGEVMECISSTLLCDLYPDCKDGSDEKENVCAARSCPSAYYRCDSGQCIPLAELCDMRSQCSDGTDEKPEICQYESEERFCNDPLMFFCEAGTCLQLNWLCDFTRKFKCQNSELKMGNFSDYPMATTTTESTTTEASTTTPNTTNTTTSKYGGGEGFERGDFFSFQSPIPPKPKGTVPPDD